MNIMIISNGEISNYNYYRGIEKDYEYIICADGGTRHAYKLGIIPDLILGDMDSLEQDIYEYFLKMEIDFIKYKSDKDKSDTYLALEKAVDMKPNKILLIGCIGNRMDHTLSNIMAMIMPVKAGIGICIKNESNEIYLIDDSICIEGKAGEYLSLIPILDDVVIRYTTGLHYNLENSVLPISNPSYGLSNLFITNSVKIQVDKGMLLITKSIDPV